ncbi:MAG: 6-carboxytetrahydropterin synthase QueD [Arcobacter sp.]|jgi:6-pyruvoyltetrahydropterin/6-carboxytetrahydropterin synthase|uniref:6-carboxytetrahydropterin synthase QueD n=1 Tax=unclassified Arcobacter TaxID=2593671 RepID=UPI0002296365|nr:MULTISPECIES: 6-carboxytetrahydropterin synthase QueD [unclassified Arcobacter]MDY3200339.1 6-carboxytetrahydropterin synthase QueD [Arcobacter sp.]BAK74103.1 6-pyruvoyl-tetrahydropterin synthase [Arcobacter sp. L]
MIIRKKFKFEGAHIVRNCSTNRCKKSIHGHSYIVEVFFTSNKLDNGYMILDFGLTKKHIENIIDSFDHAYSMWSEEKEEFKNFFKTNSERWIEMPVSPSAESYSLMFLKFIDHILKNTTFSNAEGDVLVTSVRVHETKTGYAEAFREDMELIELDIKKVVFSKEVINEWKEKDELIKILSF